MFSAFTGHGLGAQEPFCPPAIGVEERKAPYCGPQAVGVYFLFSFLAVENVKVVVYQRAVPRLHSSCDHSALCSLSWESLHIKGQAAECKFGVIALCLFCQLHTQVAFGHVTAQPIRCGGEA